MIVSLALLALAAAPAMDLDVDLREAPRRILHTRLSVPAEPGPLTLYYPKWIPGEHGPDGPIADVAGLRVSAAGRPLAWERDAADMYAFHVQVPRGASRVDVSLDYLAAPPAGKRGYSAASSFSSTIAVLEWNLVLLYPKGPAPRDLRVRAAVTLPPGWKWGSSLVAESESGGRVAFAPVSLETLVDSPVLAGAHLREVPLGPAGGPPHSLVVASETEAALAMPAQLKEKYDRLVAEAQALFGARHYQRYRFLLALSDQVTHFGLEHHQSSDNRLGERYFSDPEILVEGAGLLPHEYVHSWNGKYRRPRGLATRDYQEAMRGDLLWVYEGLTSYLGDVLAARSGLFSPEGLRDVLAFNEGAMAATVGRAWRPLGDTAVAAQVLYRSREDWNAWRRSVDFYPEGVLLWLEADAVIRQGSDGKRSLDDFCRLFFGGESGPPEVRPYDLEEVLAALGRVFPHDWKGFFAARVSTTADRAPLGGIERAGWRLGFAEKPSPYFKARMARYKELGHLSSIGLSASAEDGRVVDVVPGSPADKAGVAPAERIVAVDGRRFTPEVLSDGIAETRRGGRLDLLLENADFFSTHVLQYRDGLRYPVLERDPSRPDLLAEIGAARAR